VSFAHPEWLLLAAPAAAVWWIYLRHSPRTRWLRLAALIVVVVALADPRWQTRGLPRQVTLVVDRSLSMKGTALTKGEEIAELLAERAPGLRLRVVGFGRGAAQLVDTGEAARLHDLDDHDESDLTSGLRMAAALATPGTAEAILLVSDGDNTGADPMSVVPALRQKDIPVYVLPLSSARTGPDTMVRRVDAPTTSVRGQLFPISVEIDSPVAQSANLSLRKGSKTLTETRVELTPGINRVAMPWVSAASGLQEYTVDLDVEGDAVIENNQARVAVSIVGPPRVLVLNRAARRTALTRALKRSGLEVEISDGSFAPTSAKLSPFIAVVLDNIPMSALGDGADIALARYVELMGGGLLVTGGRESYAMGGYYLSAIEELLPVTLDREQRTRRPKLALAIVMDRSGSMGMSVNGRDTKMDLANRSAIEALKLLLPYDEAAVLAVDSEAHIITPLIAGAAQNPMVTQQVLGVTAGGGGIYAYTALEAAMAELDKSTSAAKHILLFTDAADTEYPGAYQELIAAFRNKGGSVSVVALGSDHDSDARLCRDIAKRGGGRAFFTNDPESLPRFFAEDVMRLSRESFVTGKTRVVPHAGLTALGFRAREFPNVGGYNLTHLAAGADLWFATGDKERAPLAAAWQRGLGKVAALTFEADGKHTGGIARWPRYQSLFVHIIEWIKRADEETDAVADLTMVGREARVTVELDRKLARKLPVVPKVLIVPPGRGEPFSVPLSWAGPTTLAATFRAESDHVYHGAVLLPGRVPIPIPPATLPYSPEFAPKQGDGFATLERLAAATTGRRLGHVHDVVRWLEAKEPEGRTLVPWLAALLLLLALVDIANRRGLLMQPLARLRQPLALATQWARDWRQRRRERREADEPEESVVIDAVVTRSAVEAPVVTPAPPEPAPAATSAFARAKVRARWRAMGS